MGKVKCIVFLTIVAVGLSLFVAVNDSYAQKLGQLKLRGHYARSSTDRGGDLLTGGLPAFGLGGILEAGEGGISDRDGWGIASNVSLLAVPKDPWFGHEIWGDIGLEFSRFGDGDRARNLPSTLETVIGAVTGVDLTGQLSSKSSTKSEIATTIFNVHMGPKYRLNFGDPEPGKMWTYKRLHPFFTAAMMFGVISPPSDDITYLDIGVMLELGFDYVLPPLGGLFSIGADYRHHFFGNQTGQDIDYGTAGIALVVNF
ncbi:MAG: hypothetical protein ACUZ8E_08660 [Candidatus Anammoxibacter sp.]